MSKTPFRFVINIFLLILFSKIEMTQQKSAINDVFGKLRSGFELAGKFFGLDQTSSVAELVSEAFGKIKLKNEDSSGSKTSQNSKQAGNNNIFTGFFRVLGFESKKIGAIAVNAIIFVAQLISSSLSLKPPSQLEEARKDVKNGSPLKWMLENSKVLELFSVIDDRKLPEHIIEYVKERSLDEETGCVQLLICKTSPFIWAMQKVLDVAKNESVKSKGAKALFENLPSIEEVSKNGDSCEEKHPYCFLDLT